MKRPLRRGLPAGSWNVFWRWSAEEESTAMHVLVAEDESRLASLLAQSLSEAGWVVDVRHDGQAALDAALGRSGVTYDVLLLDWMLPTMDGVTVCRQLRAVGVHTPALILTARSAVDDRVGGLDAGADDSLVNPFALDELLARLRALPRRATLGESEDEPLAVDDLVLDPRARRV